MGHALQLLLVRLALADVDTHTQHVNLMADDTPLPGELVGKLAAIFGLKNGLDIRLPFCKHPLHGLVDSALVISNKKIRRLHRQQLGIGIAQDMTEPAVPAHKATRLVKQVKHTRQRIQDVFGKLFLVQQRHFGLLALADVHHHRNDVIDTAIGFAHMADGQACVHHMVIAVDEALVHFVAGNLARQHAVELMQVGGQIIRMRQLCP